MPREATARRLRLQWLGLGIVVLAGALPTFAFARGPHGFASWPTPAPYRVVLHPVTDPPARPHVALAEAVHRGFSRQGLGPALWGIRPLYPLLLAVPWLVLLALARRRPGWVRGTLIVLGLGIAVLEAAYLRVDYPGIAPRVLGRLETGIVYAAVLLLLFARPRWTSLPRARVVVAQHALLGVLHMATLPPTLVREHLEHGASWGEALATIGPAFHVGFWLGSLGLLLAAAPLLPDGRVRRTPPA